MIEILDFTLDNSYLDGALPVPPFPQEPIYPDWPSAWKGLESVLPALLTRFHVGCDRALEFGVEYGYSTAALAQLFQSVLGIDTFVGDQHSDLQLGGGQTLVRSDFYAYTQKNLERWPNIQLVQTDYQTWTKTDDSRYDLIHVDIVHTFEDTFACGRWAVDHAPVVIFHDTESFSEVKHVVAAIAEETGRQFYNYPYCYGLGILVNE
jgi:hypothetical protein